MNHVPPQEWISILKSTVEIDHFKLNLPQIVKISQEKLKEVQERYLNNEIKETEYINLTSDLTDDTLKLIAAQETKRNHSIKQLLRQIALVLSALFSFVVIGIPFFLKLRKEDKQFKAEMNQLKQAVLQANEANIQAMLLKKLDNIPSLLEEIKEHYKDHRREELINAQILADWQDDEKIPIESRLPYDAEFAREIKRGASFQRIDKALNIEDQQPVPSMHLNRDQRLQEAVAFLNELLKTPQDRRWTSILQIAVTRASLFTAFKAALSAFNINVANLQWEANGKYYSIKSTFSDQFPPIILEIIRHPETKTIEKVNVTVKGSLDIVSYNTANNEDLKMIIPNAITEELKYCMTFSEDNRPVISNLHSLMKTHVFISKNRKS